MVSERAIIWVLLDCHNLYCVISVSCNTGKSFLTELIISSHSLFLLGHTDMALIYKERFGVGREFLYLEFIRILRQIYLGGENLCIGILNHTVGVCRDTFTLTAVPSHKHLEKISIMESILRKLDLPDAIVFSCQFIGIRSFPFRECAYQPYVCSVRGEFTEYPSAFRKMMQTIKFISVCKLNQRTIGISRKLFKFLHHILVASLNCRGKRLEPRIVA